MSLIVRYLKRYKYILFIALGLAVVNQIFSLAEPQILRYLVDNYASRIHELSQSEFFGGVLLSLAGFIGVAFISRIAKNFQDYYVNMITQRVGASLYGDTVRHIFSLPYAVFEDQRSGQMLQQIQKARTDVQQLITSSIHVVFLSSVTILIVLVYGFWVHWLIGGSYMVIIPLLAVSTMSIGRRIKVAQKQIVVESSELAGSTTETIRNVELVKSLGLEQQETQRLNAVNDRILALELKKIRLIRLLSFTQGTLINAMRSVIIFILFFLIYQGAISIGEFFSFFIYSFYVFTPLGEWGSILALYQESRASMEVLNEILQKKPEEKPASAQPLNETLHSVCFLNVGFFYPEAIHATLDDITVDIKRGSSVAFVGPSGAGKTTLIKLIVGLYRPAKGKITINNIDSGMIDYHDLRKRIGYVSQETQLFGGTIRENLLFANPAASDVQCMDALKHAAALPIIERGDSGLDTKIGEGGIKVSGGERQRLAIARALLRNPEMIIFDEATSNLDSLTEHAITQTIRDIASMHPNLMTILIAHRLSSVIHANNIYVLERGKIVEQGIHADLIHTGGLYAALWREQDGRVL